MMKYLVILLSSSSTSYCHYSHSNSEEDLISLESLKEGIRYAFLENLSIQVVFPDFRLPNEHLARLSNLECVKIGSCKSPVDADILVLEGLDALNEVVLCKDKSYVIRTSKNSFLSNYGNLIKLQDYPQRISVVFTDVESFKEADFLAYQNAVAEIEKSIENEFEKGHFPQLNIITDRLFLETMNNCGAGAESITLAPDGNFYLCPAFFYDGGNAVGSPASGLSIPNGYLYKLGTSPMCRNCDAYNCRRCVWLNQKLTWEVCIPSHQQCVISHIERNASKVLRDSLAAKNPNCELPDITEISYLDPFDNRYNFK